MNARGKRFWTGAALVSVEMMASLVIYTGAVAAFFFLTRKRWRKYKKIDLRVFDRLQGHTSDPANRAMEAITFLGNHKFLVPANLSLMGYYLFIQKRTWFSIRVIAIALSSLGMMVLLKKLFRRQRPENPLLRKVRGLSFPSGHAMMSVTFYGLLIYIISKTAKDPRVKVPAIVSLLLLIYLIGFSRVYLRVHYTSDVLAGFTIGLIWLLIALELLERLENFNKEKVKEIENLQLVTA